MAWINVTTSFNHQTVSINLDQVLTVKAEGNGAKIQFNAAYEGRAFILPVVESFEAVTKKIQQQTASAIG